MKKAATIVSILLAIAAIAYLVLSANSLNIALRRAGYSPYEVAVMDRGFNANDREFRIIKTSQGGNPALVYMEKSGLGLWKIAYDGGEWTPDRQLASIVWIQDGGMKRYAVGQDPTFSFEWHTLYYGTNAAGPIAIDAQRLPPGVACNVQQAGTDFSVHLVSYESPETLGAADMYALIKDALNIQE